jgi:integrase/recombinase XerD
MATAKRPPRGKLRGQKAIAHSLDEVVLHTLRLWRKHHLGYDQTKYVVEQVRRRLTLQPPHTRHRKVARPEPSEIQRLIQATYRSRSKYGLMIKTLFQTGARVAEFVHIRVEDLLLDGDPPQIHITHAKRGADRYVPILPALADELRTHLQGRQTGFLFESNRHARYSTRTVQSIVTTCARTAGIKKRVYPHYCGIPSRLSCSIPGSCPSTSSRSFWATWTFQPRRFMPKPACAPSAIITSEPWAGRGRL